MVFLTNDKLHKQKSMNRQGSKQIRDLSELELSEVFEMVNYQEESSSLNYDLDNLAAKS